MSQFPISQFPMKQFRQSLALGALSAVFLAFGLSACGKKDPANCGAVSGHVISLLRTELTKDSDADRVKKARANLPTLQNALLQGCETQNWSPSVRQCIARAQTVADTRECDPRIPTPSAEGAPAQQSR